MTPDWVAGLFLAVALLFLSSGSGSAAFDDGFAAVEQGDYETAFREFMPLALAGDDLAQAMIALMYHHGRAIPQDYVEAARWYRRSAEQGNPLSQFQLGLLFHDGLGLPQDFNQALQWFRRAATQGFAAAQYSLGAIYATGKGVPQNDSEAVRWFALAAEQGIAEAQFDLGVAYATGWGAPQDGVLAYMWFNLAAARSPQGERSESAQSRSATMLVRGCRQQIVPVGKSCRATGGPGSRRGPRPERLRMATPKGASRLPKPSGQ